nr:MAG TPA: zinc-ribbon domain protein [Caudoviricetes sp.]
MAKFCRKCGKPVDENDYFCTNCGESLRPKEDAISSDKLDAGVIEQADVYVNNEVKNIKKPINAKPDKKKSKFKSGCLAGILGLIIGILIITIVFPSTSSTSSKANKDGDVADAFIESMNTTFGDYCGYNWSDYRIWYDDDLGEYISDGSFNVNGIDYQFSFRAYIYDNSIKFGKVDVIDPLGNQVIDYYNEEELEYYDYYDSIK